MRDGPLARRKKSAISRVARPMADLMICRGVNGERDGTRTHDHLIKSQVLYQLSYALVARHMILAENRFSPFGTRRRGSV